MLKRIAAVVADGFLGLIIVSVLLSWRMLSAAIALVIRDPDLVAARAPGAARAAGSALAETQGVGREYDAGQGLGREVDPAGYVARREGLKKPSGGIA